MRDCLNLFHSTGELLQPAPCDEQGESDGADTPLNSKSAFISQPSSADAPMSRPGHTVGAAVCLKKSIGAASSGTFSFSLAWDNPLVHAGSSLDGPGLLPRYYTRFFGTSGRSAASIASYALLHAKQWKNA